MDRLSLKDLKRLTKHPSPKSPILRVALIGDTATQFLATAIRGFGVAKGYNIDLFEAEYNQVYQQFMDPDSELYKHDVEFIVLFQSTHKLCEKHSLLSTQEQTTVADERLRFVESVAELPQLQGKKFICMNYPEIDDHPNLFICDIAGLQNKFGRDFMFDANIYVSTEMVLSVDAVPYVAGRVMDIICACKGQFKKCLILDLDNTLWGGVIGDDGLEGIQLGHGLGIGKAFTEFQMWVKKLRQRGIIICIASKNDEDKAKEPFQKHPDMVLTLDDIAVFQANWETKVDNIRTIQSILNISFDSMVFLDDNPFERNMVRENIPGITVPELPEDPAEYLEYLYSLNLFETANYSSEDKDRTKQYQVEAKRVSLKKAFGSEADFGFTPFNTPRVAQLSQRSNQFNLRTVRYTEADVKTLADDDKVVDLSFTLKDKFGDNGLIAVVIMKALDSDTLFVDTWLMSCRVLKRGMENFTLNTMLEEARRRGYKKIIGEYLPTLKNQMVREHYDQLGFIKTDEKADGAKRYELNVDDYQPKECYIVKA